jgi:hypothetical protein
MVWLPLPEKLLPLEVALLGRRCARTQQRMHKEMRQPRQSQ